MANSSTPDELVAPLASVPALDILESIPDGFSALDREGRILYINEEAAKYLPLLGWRREQLLGKNLWEEFPDLVDTVAYHGIQRAAKENVAVEYELYYPPLDRWFLCRAHPAPFGVTNFSRDITEQRRAEGELRETSERLRLALAATELGDWSWNAATEIMTLSERAAAIFGVAPGPSKPWEEMRALLHPEDRDRARQAAERAIAEHADYRTEYRVNRPDGRTVWVAVRGRPLYDAAGAITGMLGTIQDITSQKDAEAALHAARERAEETRRRAEAQAQELQQQREEYETLYEELAATNEELITSNEELARQQEELRRSNLALQETQRLFSAVFEQKLGFFGILSPEGVLLDCNELPLVVGGFTRDQVLGLLFWNTAWWNDIPEAQEALRNGVLTAAKGSTFHHESSYRTASGAWRVVEYWISPILDHEGRVSRLLVEGHDVTERAATEARLRESEARFRQLADAMPQIVWMARPDGYLDYYNRRWYEFTGLEEGHGGDESWKPVLHPDDVQQCHDTWYRAVGTGELYEIEYRFWDRKRGEYRWHLGRALPVRDEEGRILRWFGTCTDIHDQKGVMERLQEETRTVETINRVGQSLAAELDLQKLVQAATDAGTELTGAQFGAFFYNVLDEQGESYMLYTLSGAPRSAFDRFPMPRNTAIFEPTFTGAGVVRLDDVTEDPRYGQNPPYNGMPKGHLPVRSYLAVPVISRSGEVIGGLFFGHQSRGVFTDRAERLLVGIAAQAAIAIDNARLYQGAQREIEQRQQVEGALRQSEERLRTIVENSPSIIFLKDLEGRYLLMNHHEHTLLAHQPLENVIGKTDYELFPREIADYLRENDQHVLQAGQPLRFEEWGEGSGHYITQKFVLRDADGVPYAVGGISTEITEQTRLQAELRQRAEELAEADRQKDAFLAMLAHELRNPLAPVLNAIQVLQSRATDDPLVHRQSAVIDRQARHMARLLDDLLDVSRITRGKIELRKQTLDLGAVVDQAIETGRPLVEQRQHQLLLAIPPEPLYVNADPTRLHQVIGNLLNNAAKYTEPGGRITLTVEREGHEAVLRLTDTGIGISPEFLPRVFDLFTQSDRSVARSESGLGIGLTMVQRLVQLHGGTVAAHSEGVGKGSEFTVRLPLLAADALPQSSGAPASLPHGRRAGRRVLIVDDNQDAAQTLAELAALWGHEVRAVHDGRAALHEAVEYRPEVILLDISMPGMSGYEVAQALRQQPEVAGAFLIALTGYGQPEDRRRTLAAGFDRHLTKPVDPDSLRRLLAEG